MSLDGECSDLGGNHHGESYIASSNADFGNASGQNSRLASGRLLVAVFDGHGVQGHRAAQRARELFEENARSLIAPAAAGAPRELPAALNWLFFHVHKCFEREGFCQASGTTCTTAVIDPGSETVTVAHVGDSKLVIGNGGRVVFETVDHDIDAEDIRRINDSGGEVFELQLANGKKVRRAVVQGTSGPGLSISRALGDLDAHCIGVLCEPVVHAGLPFPLGSVLVAASDGVWDVISKETAVSHCAKPIDIQEVARSLACEARGLWPANDDIDDVTALVVKTSADIGSI